MARSPEPIQFRTFGGPPDQMEVIGVESDPIRDMYHFLLDQPWWVTIAFIGAVFFAVNLAFATAYWLTGGVVNARPGSFQDAFFFSVQTLGTIGYGAMYPQSLAANVLVALESLAGIVVLAVSTGIAFSKFARPSARIVFTREIAVCPVDGVPHLMFRVANQRGNLVTSARIRVALLREYRTAEGFLQYRMVDLPPLRDNHIAFTRTWSVMHAIDASSPLYGYTPESFLKEEGEIVVAVEGLDVATGQTVTAHHSYLAPEVIWGARHADIWSDLPGGRGRLDFTRFHELVPTEPVPGFPYRAAADAVG